MVSTLTTNRPPKPSPSDVKTDMARGHWAKSLSEEGVLIPLGRDLQYAEIIDFKRSLIKPLNRNDIGSIASILRELDKDFSDPKSSLQLGNNTLNEVAIKPLLERAATQHRLSPHGRIALEGFVEYYHAYRRPFPDPSQTEPAAKIFGYLTDRAAGTWNVMVMVDQKGNAIAGASGQMFDVEIGGKARKILLNEHTWVDAEHRRHGHGSTIYTALEKRFKPDMVIIEVDNAFALVDKKEHHKITGLSSLVPTTSAEAKQSSKYWVEKRGFAIDPMARLKFWGNETQGFQMATVNTTDGTSIPVPHTQISMDPASGQRPCETVFVAIKVLDSTLAKLSAADFARIHHQTQAAIDPNCASYPSYKKTQQHLRDVLPDVTLVSLTSDAAMRALEANVKAKAPYMLGSHEQDKPSLSLSGLPNFSFGR